MTRSPIRRQHVTSADGTKIAVTITGEGPPLVACPGSLATARDWRMVARALAPRMTTYAVDRRGHGDSGDGTAYGLGREQDDLAAVMELAGPDATLLGHSYGALIALELARRRPPVRLVLYEPPLALENLVGGPVLEQYARIIGADDVDAALALGLREFVGMPDEAIAMMRQQPIWARLSGMAPGWTREIGALDEFLVDLAGDLGRYSNVTVPVLLLAGELSPPWLTAASQRLARSLPDVTVVQLPGQAHDGHIFAANLVAEEIAQFALGDASQV
jgi:pimeloyl-ACP methyl ester carboxylesterase